MNENNEMLTPTKRSEGTEVSTRLPCAEVGAKLKWNSLSKDEKDELIEKAINNSKRAESEENKTARFS